MSATEASERRRPVTAGRSKKKGENMQEPQHPFAVEKIGREEIGKQQGKTTPLKKSYQDGLCQDGTV